VAGMPTLLPCAHVSNDDLRAGRVGPALERVLETPFPRPPDLSGAQQAGRRLATML